MTESVHLRLALAQINPTVGDVDGNAELISEAIGGARDAGAQLVLLPELCLSGYPPEDLLLRGDFLHAVRASLESLAGEVSGIVALVGFPERAERTDHPPPNPMIDPLVPPAHNSLAVLAEGEVAAIYRKIRLPNYGVFDERRYFEPGEAPALIEVDGALVGLTICEDIWVPGYPESEEAAAGAQLVVNASASPYNRGKGAAREEMVAARARAHGATFALCNAVGGQDELVFDGRSVVVTPTGETLARATEFEPEMLVADLLLAAPVEGTGDGSSSTVPVIARLGSGAEAGHEGESRLAPPLEREEDEVYAALTVGLRDYVEKNDFETVVIAISGGIDSALVALRAVDALGPDRVRLVVMPSPHSSEGTQADARTIAANLGAELIEIPIDEPMRAYEQALSPSVAGTEPGLA